MFRSLKTQLALSHALPVLLFVALLGFILLNQLERVYFLDNLAVELAAQGAIISSFTREEPELWRDPPLAQFVLEQLHARISAQVMLVDESGRVIAADWFDGQQPLGRTIDSETVRIALGGEPNWDVAFNAALQDQVLDVAVPVTVSGGRVIGVVRLAHSLEEIRRRLAPLRTLFWITLGAGAGLSVLLGLVLAQSVAAPLQRLATAVSRFTLTTKPEPVPESGPSEVGTLAAAFNRMGSRLFELERSRMVLLTGIVHELGRPLGAIKAAAQTIRGADDQALAAELADGIDVQVDHLRLQVDDLALLGEMELQGLRMEIEPVDLADLVQAQCRQFTGAAADKQITLSCQTDPNLPMIYADPKRINQIVGNLLHNAIKYTPVGGQVRIVTSPATPLEGEAAAVAVTVADSGPGIAASEQERIFDFFYRSPGQRRIHQGMGIGLALARQLAEGHGGALALEQNAQDAGARFVLRLPVQPPA
jgi:signal transduction histidine kinase